MKTFKQLAADLSKPGDEIAALMTAQEAHLWHMATGVSGEAGELLDAVKKSVVYKKPLDRENVVEELGDLRFYMAGLMNALNISEQEILYATNKKLGKRYASGSYSNEQAQERADKAEPLKPFSNWAGPGETPHEYSPDYQAMGDCSICGHVREAHEAVIPGGDNDV